MPQFCGVIGCGHNSLRDKEIRFFRIPAETNTRGVVDLKKKQRRQKWIQALHRSDLTETKLKNMRICSAHFSSGKPSADDDTDNPDYVPHLNMGYKMKEINERYKRLQARKRKLSIQKVKEVNKVVADVEPVLEEGEGITNLEGSGEGASVVENVQTECEIEVHLSNLTIDNLRKDLENARSTIKILLYNEIAFENNDMKSRFHTGLPSYKALITLFDLVKGDIKEIQSLTKFQQFALTLMHLRLNLMFTDLAYRFQVSVQTVSRIFYSCLDVLYTYLKNFIIWPTRENLIKTMPENFKKYFGNKVTVIIDCFEVKIEKSGNLLTQAATWSNYKHHNTIKMLIGACPQGAITFISRAYGGRISDKLVTERCGILEKLLPGDLVLADRGFLIQESVQLKLAKVMTPSYLKGRNQLSAFDVESTRKLAHVRIHVERVIGAVRRKYRILFNLVPLTTIKKQNEFSTSAIDQIVTVTCALTNLCPSIVT